MNTFITKTMRNIMSMVSQVGYSNRRELKVNGNYNHKPSMQKLEENLLKIEGIHPTNQGYTSY